MAEKKGNRKRWVQVKLCLTPEEKSVLDHDVRNSGLSQSEYPEKFMRFGDQIMALKIPECRQKEEQTKNRHMRR